MNWRLVVAAAVIATAVYILIVLIVGLPFYLGWMISFDLGARRIKPVDA